MGRTEEGKTYILFEGACHINLDNLSRGHIPAATHCLHELVTWNKYRGFRQGDN